MKNKNDLRIVFVGTPDFAVASLAALVDANYIIVGVITAPDKPAGRGMKPTSSAVKEYALHHGLFVLQPEKLKAPEFLESLRALGADIQIVVAFRMLPEVVWNMPPLGTINVHGSLLPAYRGAAPINWAIINGEEETGVTTFRLTHAIDTGNILMQDKLTIGEEQTAGELYDLLKSKGAALLIRTIENLTEGKLKEIPQSHTDPGSLPHAPKIFTETCRIDFNKTVRQVNNLIRGLSPVPGAFTQFQGKILKIFRAVPAKTTHPQVAGAFFTDGKLNLQFRCADGWISVVELQQEGKRKMKIEEFLRGYRP